MKEFCLKGKIFTNTLKRKQNELFKVTVQLRKDYPRLRWRWTEEVGKEDTLILLSLKPINNLNHRVWSYIRRINGQMKLKKKAIDYFEN